ncbi:MAG: hypothetical protein WBB64_00595, partial [Anaerolineales bacterium]
DIRLQSITDHQGFSGVGVKGLYRGLKYGRMRFSCHEGFCARSKSRLGYFNDRAGTLAYINILYTILAGKTTEKKSHKIGVHPIRWTSK